MDFRARQRRLAAGVWNEAMLGIYDLEPGADRTIAEIERRRVELALLAAGEGAVAVGLAALQLHGCWALPRTWKARAVRASRRQGRGGAQNVDFTMTTADGRRAATVAWAIVQAVPHIDRLHLVAVLDWALNQGHIRSVDDVLRMGAGHRWIRKVRAWGVLADGRAESFLETWARLQCVDAGVPPTALQLEIRDAAGVVRARGDLAWLLRNGRWIVVEIDGASIHDKPESIRRDRRRQNWMVGGGDVTVLRYDATDLRDGVLPAEVQRYRDRLERSAEIAS
ncbi:hypothetical protein C8046_11075 [Serinibacter arcticus]|uniref:DUF559 domain-containing protein n=1 Tax=Serinibacter arcticus TaxID=1655435 RepID=A0A2U1ZVT7_9MICO|nr:hypothetical protein [Serinibacter arcticus]PWD51107.1 hypothetical protein C8046_11075 [Serinibacter arcticus]